MQRMSDMLTRWLGDPRREDSNNPPSRESEQLQPPSDDSSLAGLPGTSGGGGGEQDEAGSSRTQSTSDAATISTSFHSQDSTEVVSSPTNESPSSLLEAAEAIREEHEQGRDRMEVDVSKAKPQPASDIGEQLKNTSKCDNQESGAKKSSNSNSDNVIMQPRDNVSNSEPESSESHAVRKQPEGASVVASCSATVQDGTGEEKVKDHGKSEKEVVDSKVNFHLTSDIGKDVDKDQLSEGQQEKRLSSAVDPPIEGSTCSSEKLHDNVEKAETAGRTGNEASLSDTKECESTASDTRSSESDASQAPGATVLAGATPATEGGATQQEPEQQVPSTSSSSSQGPVERLQHIQQDVLSLRQTLMSKHHLEPVISLQYRTEGTSTSTIKLDFTSLSDSPEIQSEETVEGAGMQHPTSSTEGNGNNIRVRISEDASAERTEEVESHDQSASESTATPPLIVPSVPFNHQQQRASTSHEQQPQSVESRSEDDQRKSTGDSTKAGPVTDTGDTESTDSIDSKSEPEPKTGSNEKTPSQEPPTVTSSVRDNEQETRTPEVVESVQQVSGLLVEPDTEESTAVGSSAGGSIEPTIRPRTHSAGNRPG